MLIKPSSGNLLETVGKWPLEGFVIYSKTARWWGRLLGDYSHVSLIIRRGDNWIWFEPSVGFSEVQIFPMGMKWRGFFENATHVQKFRVWRDVKRYRAPWLFRPFTCVEQVKSFLGIQSFWVLTPKQLFKRLDK